MTASTSSAARWRAAGHEAVRWERLGDDYVAYHRPSGKTHFLNGASRVLLCEILTEPKPLAQIGREFAAGAEDLPGDFTAELLAMLSRFEQLGLVTRQ